MKPIICLYTEGSDTKVAVFTKDKEGIKLLSAGSVSNGDEAQGMDSSLDTLDDLAFDDVSDEFSFDENVESQSGEAGLSAAHINEVASHISIFSPKKASFIPIVSEPAVNYHIYNGEKLKDKKKLISAIISDIKEHKGILVAPDSIDCIDFTDDSTLGVFLEGENSSVNTVNALAAVQNERFYKISTIKSAELSLGYYVSKTNKFFPEDYSLVIYTGREYSKLIFLEGQNFKHIGTSLDIGTENLHTYDVYFSKILLEMENGGIPRLDNVILCGEDTSENLILSFYGTFPEANVTELKFDNIETSGLQDEITRNLSSYSIPISVATEYFAEQDDEYKGVNILPRHIKENQKFFQFGWHTIAMLPLLFLATFFFTYIIQSNSFELRNLNNEVNRLERLQVENQAKLDQISHYDSKISGFDKTQTILDSVSQGAEIWTDLVYKTSNFIERRRNFWIKSLALTDEMIEIEGYSMSRPVLTQFADYNNSSLLKNILYEPLREENTFAYSLRFPLANKAEMVDGP
ncbi:MAG: hypothetical protein JEY94_09765 [Melioribacteraceae bacterium]|nr:hypothetical protein [Melioribacteraceae bacterium]